MQTDERLRYPIGRFQAADSYEPAERAEMLDRFRRQPRQLGALCKQIEALAGWETSYRPGGWTARQVVHHLTDSHLNAYQRFKHTLTEENPVLRGYDEGAWALLDDYQLGYFVSLKLLEAVHERLYFTLSKLDGDQWLRGCLHPSMASVTNLADLLAAYEWHGRHHLGHLKIIINKLS